MVKWIDVLKFVFAITLGAVLYLVGKGMAASVLCGHGSNDFSAGWMFGGIVGMILVCTMIWEPKNDV